MAKEKFELSDKEPDIKDFKEAARIMQDFGIKILHTQIPRFKTMGDLNRWKRTQIKRSLGDGNS